MKRETIKQVNYAIDRINSAVSLLRKHISNEPIEKGVFMIRSHFGYDVQVDGTPLGTDQSWTAANDMATQIAALRPQTDEMGYSRKPDPNRPRLGKTCPKGMTACGRCKACIDSRNAQYAKEKDRAVEIALNLPVGSVKRRKAKRKR